MAYRGFERATASDSPDSPEGRQFLSSRLETTIGMDLVLNLAPSGAGSRVTMEYSSILSSRGEINALTSAIDLLLKGRKTPVWVSTGSWDLPLYDNVLHTGGTLAFYNNGAQDLFNAGWHRRYFMFGNVGWAGEGIYTPWAMTPVQMYDCDDQGGNVVWAIFNDTPGMSGSNNGLNIHTERLRVSRMYLMRLTDDEVRLRWHGRNLLEVNLSFVEVPRQEYP